MLKNKGWKFIRNCVTSFIDDPCTVQTQTFFKIKTLAVLTEKRLNMRICHIFKLGIRPYSHTIFYAQYCDIAINRFWDKNIFFNQYFLSCVNWKYLFLDDSAIDAYNLKILWNVTTIFWWKNYLFIAILCVQMSRVNKAYGKLTKTNLIIRLMLSKYSNTRTR